MCQIISTVYNNKIDAKNKLFSKDAFDDTMETLNVKGSDEYSFFCYSESSDIVPLIIKGSTQEDFEDKIYKNNFEKLRGYLDLFNTNEVIGVVWFSRQKPEEEAEEVNLPPYFNKRLNEYFWIHGTINNDKELLEEFRIRELHTKCYGEVPNTTVDTEIFKYLQKVDFSRLKGLFTYFSLDWDFKTDGIIAEDHGMGLWTKRNNSSVIQQCSPFDNTKFQIISNSTRERIDNISIAFSGGMDIALSTFNILSQLKSRQDRSFFKDELGNQLITLNYFKYGTNAEEKEIEVCNKLLGFYKASFPELNINLEIIELPGVVLGMAEAAGEYLKITDKNAIGDSKETEENISYVPYRNTLFCMTLAARLQKFQGRNDNNIIVLGLNLSEGMVFGDNNSSLVEHTERMISYGGKFYQNIKIISPYLNRTKTNTLKEFQISFGKEILKHVLELSFSCYYPKNGKACNECGSCILRNKAIENLK